jgi:thymidylate synthase
MTAWVPNIYGLMAIQRKVAEGTGTPIGPITVISHSLGLNPGDAGLMERAQRVAEAWDRDDDINPETGKRELRADPNGYFTIDIDERAKQIHVQHWYKDLPIKEYRGKKAAVIERAIIGDMAVSLVSHALWLGRELADAEARLRRPRKQQDQ